MLKEALLTALVLSISASGCKSAEPTRRVVTPTVPPIPTETFIPSTKTAPPTQTQTPQPKKFPETLTPTRKPTITPTEAPIPSRTPKPIKPERGDLIIKSGPNSFLLQRVSGQLLPLPDNSLFELHNRSNCSSRGSFCIEVRPDDPRELQLVRPGQSPGTIGRTDHKTKVFSFDPGLIALSDTLQFSLPQEWGKTWDTEFGFVIVTQFNTSGGDAILYYGEVPESHHQGEAATIRLRVIRRLVWDEDVPVILGSITDEPAQLFRVLPGIPHHLTEEQKRDCPWGINQLTECLSRYIKSVKRSLQRWEIPALKGMTIEDLAIVR